VSHETESSKTTGCAPRVAVIGVGNLLLKDEGVGVHIVRTLQEMPLGGKGELTIVDGGTCPDTFYLLPKGVDKVIIIDAVRGGGEPGTIYRFAPQDIAFRRGTITSLHQLGVAEGLRMIEHTELNPKDIVIIGVEPKEIDWGLEISPELRKKVPQIIELVKKEMGSLEEKQ
jgi:hydrogenase maturation protease